MKDYDRIYTFNEGTRRKWAFYNDKYKANVIVDESTGQILTMYRIDNIDDYIKDNKVEHYLEIL